MKQLRNTKGFTLVELMIVVAIIGILAAIAIPQYMKYIEKSERTAVISKHQTMIDNIRNEAKKIAGLRATWVWPNIYYSDAADPGGTVALTARGDAAVITWVIQQTLAGRANVNVVDPDNPSYRNNAAAANEGETGVQYAGGSWLVTGTDFDGAALSQVSISKKGDIQ